LQIVPGNSTGRNQVTASTSESSGGRTVRVGPLSQPGPSLKDAGAKLFSSVRLRTAQAQACLMGPLLLPGRISHFRVAQPKPLPPGHPRRRARAVRASGAHSRVLCAPVRLALATRASVRPAPAGRAVRPAPTGRARARRAGRWRRGERQGGDDGAVAETVREGERRQLRPCRSAARASRPRGAEARAGVWCGGGGGA
jgi:hypothetical protein